MYTTVPVTGFDCNGQTFLPGIYADTGAQCQVGRHFRILFKLYMSWFFFRIFLSLSTCARPMETSTHFSVPTGPSSTNSTSSATGGITSTAAQRQASTGSTNSSTRTNRNKVSKMTTLIPPSLQQHRLTRFVPIQWWHQQHR